MSDGRDLSVNSVDHRAAYDARRQEHGLRISQAFKDNQQALSWRRARIADFQTRRLRWLLGRAEASPFWHERLRDINVSSFGLEDLAGLAVLTKREMMDNWPDLITLRGVTTSEAYEFLDTLDEDRYFHETYHLVSSGGSSGEPALFLYDWDGWAGCAATIGRYSARLAQQYPELARPPGPTANVGAGRGSHMTYAMACTFAPAGITPNLIPVGLPIAEIVGRLNLIQPARLTGYPSMLLLLTEEARAGRLTIGPHTVQPSSEPLTPEIREALKSTWDPIILNIWGCSEACCVANSYGNDRGMYINEDFVIVEPVDADNQPVPPGVQSEKVLITNLFNAAQPLIRYELTDRVTVIDEPSPSGLEFARIEDIEGRTDDIFSYGSIRIHPILFRGPLARAPGLLEFQVRQTPDGASIDYLANSDINETELTRSVIKSLRGAGLDAPSVVLQRVDRLERVGVGKLKRFFPLEDHLTRTSPP
ncbi:MAG: hypothetical protein O2868_08270 [Proteobacteria bacterium]|nr:hypothetical protein [Pseudomonadota bacterium]